MSVVKTVYCDFCARPIKGNRKESKIRVQKATWYAGELVPTDRWEEFDFHIECLDKFCDALRKELAKK